MPSLLHCLFCGERIGIYDPIIVVEDDREHSQTSLAREPEVRERTRTFVIHASCAPTTAEKVVDLP